LSCNEDIEGANKVYLSKKEQLDEVVEQEDWISYLALHERPHRLEALLELIQEFKVADEQIWPVVGWAWSDTEGVRWNLDTWRGIWSMECQYRHLVMHEDERKVFDQLPEQMTIWRGVNHEDAVQGLSWTLNRDTAVRFAKRFAEENDPLLLAKGQVTKGNVLAYFADRKEDEIVVMPENVCEIEVTELDRTNR
jgi:hypothetical protein